MSVKSNLEVTLRFVECINRHDLAGITALMTQEHKFIDSLGVVHNGRETMREGWRQFFKMAPDYRIEVSRTMTDGEEVILLGTARATYAVSGRLDPRNQWATPAAWRALIRDLMIDEWQVYADNEPVRQRIREAGQS